MTDSERSRKMKKIFYGYEYAKNPFIDSKYYKEALVRLENIELINLEKLRLPKYDKAKVKKEAQSFFFKYFKGTNFTVNLFKQNDFIQVAKIINMTNSMHMDSGAKRLISLATNLVNEKSKNCSVFNLPIKELKDTDSIFGAAVKTSILLDDEEYLKRTPVSNHAICLGDRYNKLSVGTYSHEITHALLERHKGVVKNIFNAETLSIFMEKLAIDSVDSSRNKKFLKISEIYRLSDTQRNIKDLEKGDIDEKTKAMQYIYGTLMSGVLFDKYQNGSSQEQKRILEGVKTVLNGNKTVEEFLEEEQITLDNENVEKYLDKVETYVEEIQKDDAR